MHTAKFPARFDSLESIGELTAQAAIEAGFDDNAVYEVQLAVDEAATNIIKYAYGEKEGPLRLIMELHGKVLMITLVSWGKPFDPTAVSAPDLTAGLEERRIGGLGMYLIRKMMDEVSYSFDPTGNRLIMKKNLA